MSKTQVYSWRLDDGLKSALEQAARDSDTSVASLLEEIVTSWLAERENAEDDAERQERLRASGRRYIGSIEGDDPDRAANASERLQEILKRKRAG